MERDPEEIPEGVNRKREFILNLLTEKFDNAEINSEKVQFLFHAYDLVFFKGQILKRLKSLSKDSTFTPRIDPKLTFESKKRNSGYGSLSGFYYEKNLKNDVYIYKKKYFIDISPDILKTVETGKGIPKAGGIGCTNKFECFMLIMEHEIIHLLFSLWEFDDASLQKRNYKVYGPHGQLFECMLNTYFGHTEYSHNLSLNGIEFPNYISQTEEPIKEGFSYWENSCYMDSVLTLLLENQCSFWRTTIFNWGETNNESANPELAEMMKEELRKDYSKLEKGEPVECKKFRKLLSVHDPLIKKDGRWVMYETSAFYANLAELYPNLKIDVPIRMIRPSLAQPIESIRYKSEYLFTVEEYINPDFSLDDDYKEILWDECKSPVLVFTNQRTRKIKTFDIESEDKKRVLKPRILGKYKLVGVVTLEGHIGEKGGGVHYISYFVARDGNWYSYNDMNSKIKIVGDGYVDDLPRSGIWQEKNNKMPSLYFYALDEYGIDKRKTKHLTFEKVKRKDGGFVFRLVIDGKEIADEITAFAEKLDAAMTIENSILFLRLDGSNAMKMEDFLLDL